MIQNKFCNMWLLFLAQLLSLACSVVVILLPGEGNLLTLSRFHDKLGCSSFASTGAIGSLSENRTMLSAQPIASVVLDPSQKAAGAMFFSRQDGTSGLLAAVFGERGGVSVSLSSGCGSEFVLQPSMCFALSGENGGLRVLGLLESTNVSVVVLTNVSFVKIGFAEGGGLTVIANEVYAGVLNQQLVGVGSSGKKKRTLVYQSKIVDASTGLETSLDGENGDFSPKFVSVLSIVGDDLGNSSWGASIFGVDQVAGSLVGAFQFSGNLFSCNFRDYDLAFSNPSSNNLTPKFVMIDDAVITFHGLTFSSVTNMSVISVLAYSIADGAPKPVFDPRSVWSVLGADSGCVAEPNPFMLMEDGPFRGSITLAPGGPSIVDLDISSSTGQPFQCNYPAAGFEDCDIMSPDLCPKHCHLVVAEGEVFSGCFK
jgi:hypothetical protein